MTGIKILIVDGEEGYRKALSKCLALQNKLFRITARSGLCGDRCVENDGGCRGIKKKGTRDSSGQADCGRCVSQANCGGHMDEPDCKAKTALRKFDLLLIREGRRNGGGQEGPWTEEEIEAFLGKWEAEGRLLRHAPGERVSQLAARIYIAYAKVFGGEPHILDCRGKTKITGFISGAGGAGKTAAALAFSKFLARDRGEKVLYLSFEAFDSAGFYAELPSAAHGLNDFLYYLFSRDQEAAASYPEGFLVRDPFGVFFFSAEEGKNELKTLAQEELIRFFEGLLRWGQLDRLVLDLPVDIDRQAAFLLKSCSCLALVGNGSRYADYRNERLRAFLKEEMELEENIFLFHADWEAENFMETQAGMAVDTHHQLGREVRELAERMEG